MINLRHYYLDNSLRYSKWNYVPKRYVAAFAMLHQGKKITTIWSAFADLYHSNGTHKKGFDEFLESAFVLNGKGKILDYKDLRYKGVVLNEEFPFSHSLMNGIKSIETVLGLESFFDVDEETMRKMLNVKYEDLSVLPVIDNCGVNQSVFDFVLARECSLTQETKKYSDIAELFFSLLIYGELLSTLVDSVRPEQKDDCLYAIKSLSLSSYNPRFELSSIDELKSFDVNKLFFYYGFNINVLVNLLNYYSEKAEDIIPEFFSNFISSLDDEIEEILTRRETETLEEIGQSKGLTRERIRQKEADGLKDFADYYLDNLSSNDKNMIFLFPKISYVFPINSFKDKLGRMNDCFRNLMANNKFVGTAKYIKALDAVIENEQVISIFNDTINEVFGDFFKKEDMQSKIDESLESLGDYGFNADTIVTFISNAYKDRGTAYAKNGIRFSKDFQVNVVLTEHFDNGFAFSNDEDIELLNKYGIELFGAPIFSEDEYGEKAEQAKKTAGTKNKQKNKNVKAVIDRCDVRQIDRGKYIHISKAVDLPIDLMDKIITYLNLKNRAIAYSNILETFKEELEEICITNRYALQGAMSKYKGELFNCDKFYVTPINIQQTLRDSMIEWIDSRTGLFTYDHFKEEFKGVAMSVFMSAIYQYKNVAYYWQQGYITLKALHIDDNLKAELNKYLSIVIAQYHMNYCSADEIYNFIKIHNPQFINEASMKYSYDLFSVLELLFTGIYQFKRPLIGNLDVKFETGDETLSKYLESKTIVKLSSLRRFLDNKIVDKYFTIHGIIFDKYNEFVVVDQDTMIRKENLNISDREIVRLDLIIEMVLEQKHKIDIQKDIVEEYYFTEIARIKTNRYLLFGIINTFLHDKYEILMETIMFRYGQFSVKRR